MGRGLVEFAALPGPGDDAVRPDQDGVESELVVRRAGRITDPARPALCGVFQVAAEVGQNTVSVLKQVAQAGAVLKAEVRGVPAGKRVLERRRQRSRAQRASLSRSYVALG
ncbi:hypothetical protein ODJ79_02615 [Actinoplanes sp. KI2]|nr:hypothetical protein [Actinoplanes sp. KI2]MCU7722599.1 hypothetical protein [Actinoplanes sp. KI2]